MAALPPGTEVPDPVVRRAASDLNDAAQRAHESLPTTVQGILDALVQGRPTAALKMINMLQTDLAQVAALAMNAAGHEMRAEGRRAAETEPDMREERNRDWHRAVSNLMLAYQGHVGGDETSATPYGAGQPLRGRRS